MIRIVDLKTMTETQAPPNSVLCLGNFDGVHIGHRALIKATVCAKERLAHTFAGLKSGAWLFETPPSLTLNKKSPPQLMTLREKLSCFAALGLDYAFLADFAELRDVSPANFVEQTLKKECRCVYAVCGFNFRFAKMASGDAESLMALMDGRGETVGCVSLDGEAVSSSTIRSLLAEGNVEKANRMLGDPFTLTATVLHGKALGKNLGVPTINQHFGEGAIRPADGVYISQTRIDGSPFPSVSNIGTRPTFEDGSSVNCETHILGYDGDLYGKAVTVEFLRRLRGEIAFFSVELLKKQLQEDIAATANYFKYNT